MVILGIDAHKRSHTVVAVDGNGRPLGDKTFGTTSADHLQLLQWADRFGPTRRWAVEDCRHLSRRLEQDLLAGGEQIVRVPPKLMAHVRDSARSYGKSDPIDALAVARAALREPGLPAARLDGPDRDIRLLSDHRASLVADRTRTVNRLRWHLHELDPGWEPAARTLHRPAVCDEVEQHISTAANTGAGTADGGAGGVVARLARALLDRIRQLTGEIDTLTAELTTRLADQAPSLLAVPGCGPLTAAVIVGQTAGVDRFTSRNAYARHNGSAPLPVWSSNKPRHRLSRTGNRQLNAALHRIAITQTRCHPDARTMIARRVAGGSSNREALRVLKRRLSDVVYRALQADLHTPAADTAA